jgi:hypothetical protein
MTVMEMPPKAAALLTVHLQIGSGKPGAVLFTLDLLVDPVHEQVNGFGHMTQAINPPLDIPTRVEGNFTYMTVMPNNGHLLVTATGYPPVSWPVGGGVGPVLLPNVQLWMIMSPDWTSGTANYKYRIDETTWKSITDVPVKGSHEAAPAMASGKTIELTPESIDATYLGRTLKITASGREDGVKNISIIPIDFQKLVFAVEGEPSPAIGNFPYTVTADFQLPEKPAFIYLKTPQGIKEVPVRDL